MTHEFFRKIDANCECGHPLWIHNSLGVCNDYEVHDLGDLDCTCIKFKSAEKDPNDLLKEICNEDAETKAR